MTLEQAKLVRYLIWLIEVIKRRCVPAVPGHVTWVFKRRKGMLLVFALKLPATNPLDKVTKRTLTRTVTPQNGTPGDPIVEVVSDGQEFTYEENDTVASFLVDTNVNGDSAPGPTTVILITEPTPTGVPASPGAVSWDFLRVAP